jgi:hypothetical protein
MGEGDRRRQRQRAKQNSREEGNHPAFIAFAMLAFGFQTAAIFAEEISTGLDRLYCTPESCLTLPQALIGWAFAVAPLPVYLWDRRAALYVSSFLVGLMGMLLIASSGRWVVPLSFFLVGLVFVPISVGISRWADPGRRALVVAGEHWLLLVGLILWLA